ncbi:MAG: tetratricopeptide repeat protein [Ignavibacteriae bacterium]|nr:MAG: tetratricopeptide repeat protein [Ignavibacteriota bacterium]
MKQLRIFVVIFLFIPVFIFLLTGSGCKNIKGERYKDLARNEYKKDNKMKALEYINKSIEMNPKDASSYNIRGNIYVEMYEEEKALIDYNKSIELDQKHWRYYSDRGGLYFNQKKFKESIDDFTTSIKLKSDIAHSYYFRGMSYYLAEPDIYKDTARTNKALYDLQKVTELDSVYWEAYNALGNLYLDLMKPDLAIKEFKTAASIKPDDPLIHFRIGLAYYLSNDYVNAMPEVDKAIELNRKYSKAFKLRGWIFSKTGDKKSAKIDSVTAAKLDEAEE